MSRTVRLSQLTNDVWQQLESVGENSWETDSDERLAESERVYYAAEPPVLESHNP